MFRLLLILFLSLSCTILWSQKFDEDKLQKGIDLYLKGEFDASLKVLLECVPLAQKYQDSVALQSAYTNLGNVYSSKGSMEEALDYYQKALDIATHTSDTLRQAKITNNIATIYSDLKDFPVALEYFEKAIKLAQQVDDYYTMADCANGKAMIKEQQSDYDEAIKLYMQALEIYQELNTEDRLALVYNNLGVVYKQQNRLDQTIYYYNKALEIAERLEAKYFIAAISANLAGVYLLQKQYPKAIEMNFLAMEKAKEIGATSIWVETYGNLMDVYAEMKDYKKAFEYAKIYKEANDSLINTERTAQLAEMKEKYESERKEAENVSLRQKNQLNELLLNKKATQIRIRNILLFGSLLIIVLLVIGVKLYISRQQEKVKLQKILTIKETERQERIRIAKDLHDDLGAGLTKINFLGELIVQETSDNNKTNNYGKTIKETVRQLSDNIRILIWSLNSENLNINEFIYHIRQYTFDYFEELPIKINFQSSDIVGEKNISKESFRQLFMTIKECLNNIAKHSEASEIKVNFAEVNGKLQIVIQDNGKGFIEPVKTSSNGLKNIRNRVKSVGGEVNIDSRPGKGTKIEMVIEFGENLYKEVV